MAYQQTTFATDKHWDEYNRTADFDVFYRKAMAKYRRDCLIEKQEAEAFVIEEQSGDTVPITLEQPKGINKWLEQIDGKTEADRKAKKDFAYEYLNIHRELIDSEPFEDLMSWSKTTTPREFRGIWNAFKQDFKDEKDMEDQD